MVLLLFCQFIDIARKFAAHNGDYELTVSYLP